MRAPHPFALVLAAGLSAAGTSSAQSSIYHFDGAQAGDRHGKAVAVLSDLDGDGRDEVAVGAPRDATAGAGAGAVRLYDGLTGLEVGVLYGQGEDERFGYALAAAGDVDADGFVDLIASGPSECGTGIIGLARVYSGADLAELHVVHGDTFLDWFGCAVSAAGDQDQDGHADFAVGAHSFCAGFELPGYVRAFSGATGLERWTREGNFKWDTFGWALESIGDFDQDGVPDMLVGAPGNDDGGYDSGRFHLLSGVDGAQLHSEKGEAGLHYSGFAVAATGDVDLDGVVDYAIGVPGEQDNFPTDPAPSPGEGGGGGHPSDFGKLQIHTGATHTVLWERYGAGFFDHLGYAVETLGDLDLDGHPEVAAAAGRYDVQGTLMSFGPAYVEAISSADGELVLHVDHAPGMLDKEVDLAVGDVNADGVPDFVLGSPSALGGAGTVRAYSSQTLGLSSPTHLIQVKGGKGGGPGKGGKQELLIAPGAEHDGLPYRVVGSFSGLGPGFRLGGVSVPLIADDYTAYTLGDGPGDLLKHFTGVVGHGKQVATFKPPKDLVAKLEGETVYHVLVVYDALGNATWVSPPVPGSVQF